MMEQIRGPSLVTTVRGRCSYFLPTKGDLQKLYDRRTENENTCKTMLCSPEIATEAC